MLHGYGVWVGSGPSYQFGGLPGEGGDLGLKTPSVGRQAESTLVGLVGGLSRRPLLSWYYSPRRLTLTICRSRSRWWRAGEPGGIFFIYESWWVVGAIGTGTIWEPHELITVVVEGPGGPGRGRGYSASPRPGAGVFAHIVFFAQRYEGHSCQVLPLWSLVTTNAGPWRLYNSVRWCDWRA